MLDDTDFRFTEPSLTSSPNTGGRVFWSILIQAVVVLLVLGAIVIAASIGLFAALPDSPQGMELVGP